MPKITINTPFNFQSGGQVKHYAKGEQEVPHAVADHASVRGYSPKPKDEVVEPASAEPASELALAKGSKKP